jgi:hypothetical protein
LFSDYGEFLRLTRPLPLDYKKKIVDALSQEEKRSLRKDFISGGWDNIVYRNEIDSSSDRIKRVFNKDPLRLRSLVLKGNAIKVPYAFWHTFVEDTKHIPKKYLNPFVGGIEVQEDPDDPQYVVLKRKGNYEQE